VVLVAPQDRVPAESPGWRPYRGIRYYDVQPNAVMAIGPHRIVHEVVQLSYLR
jgi:hypothetical protein